MPAVKAVQITLLGERNYPIASATGVAEAATEAALRDLMALNPAITASDVVMAIWEEGARIVAAQASRKLLPRRLAGFKVVKPARQKPNPRPVQ